MHKKTYEAFAQQFVQSGKPEAKLLSIYRKMLIRAEELRGIFKTEKWKRGKFTYHKLPQANKEPAEESIGNATMFYKHIQTVLNA